MRLTRLAALLFVLALGAALGLAATWLAIRRGFAFDSVRVGPWTATPRAAAPTRDPYVAAANAASGENPFDLAEGVAFLAERDSAGRPLSGRCVYRLRGAPPPARYWTLSVADPQGRLFENPAGRYGFVSSEIVRDERGGIEIMLAPRARAGAWLPTTGLDAMILSLRLYDTPASAMAAGVLPPALPSVERLACP